MIPRLRSIQLTRKQVAFVAVLSGIATGVIIASALGQNTTERAILAALGRRVIVHAGAGVPATSQGTGSSAESVSAPPVAPTLTQTAPPTPTDTGVGVTDQPSATATGGNGGTSSGGNDGASGPHYPVKHVFVVALSTPDYAAAWGKTSAARYLNGTLRKQGTLLSGYHSLGGAALPDLLAMVSGEHPDRDTRADCTTYSEFPTTVKPAKDGQLDGNGCVYPNTVLTIGDQVTSSGSKWGAFIADMGTTSCLHANSDTADDAPLAGAGPDYDTRHNPFIYFHSLLDLGDCSTDDVSLEKLPAALASASRTPAYSFIAPGSCEDAVETTCLSGRSAGIEAEDAFLKQWVPKILASPAYKQNGEIIVVFTPPGLAKSTTSAPAGSATATGATGSTTTPASPSATTPASPSATTPATTTAAATAAGAAGTTPPASPPQTPGAPLRMGALVISRYTKRGATIDLSYDPYSILRSVEDVFGFTPLAAAADAKSFAGATLSSS